MKSKAEKLKKEDLEKETGQCKRINRSVHWPVWLIDELEACVTPAGFRSFSKYLEWVVYRELGYTKKSYIKKCEEEARKESK